MKFSILTLFPDFFNSLYSYSVLGRGISQGIFEIETVNIRDFSMNKHRKVDDYSYGGGPGMVMKAEPIVRAIEDVKDEGAHTIYLSPKGTKLSQGKLKELSKYNHLILLNGHYEGVDERVLENFVDEEISIGDYILSGGEVASMVLIDGISRLLEGVLSNSESTQEESHSTRLLEYPQYTRPVEFRGYKVPDILLSGDHKKIDEYRHKKSLEETFFRRPDLIETANLSVKDREFIEKLKNAKEEE